MLQFSDYKARRKLKGGDEFMKFNKNRMWLAIIIIMVVLTLPLLLSGRMDAFGETPGFLRVGGYYRVDFEGIGGRYDIKVLEIRGGWIRVQLIDAAEHGPLWLNPLQMCSIYVKEKPTRQ
jgi:hypothetical protein